MHLSVVHFSYSIVMISTKFCSSLHGKFINADLGQSPGVLAEVLKTSIHQWLSDYTSMLVTAVEIIRLKGVLVLHG